MNDIEHDWAPGSSGTDRKTNRCIKALLEWYDKQDDVRKITRSNIEDCVKEIANVDSDSTVDKYVDRIIRHGPFEQAELNRWRVTLDE